MARKYGAKAQKKVEKVMHEKKEGTFALLGGSGRRSRAASRRSPSRFPRPGKQARRSPRSGAEPRKSSLGRPPMASRLLQKACKVPWKLEPLPPKAPA